MVIAAGYMRCSGNGQINGDTWDRQNETIRACAAKLGAVVQEFREEAVAGKLDSDERPTFQAMIAWMQENDCTLVIVERMDRLARMYRIQEELISELASYGFTLIAADTGENITESMMGDPMRRALVQIQGIFAELAKNMDNMKLAKARKRIRTEGRREGSKHYSPDPVANKRVEGQKPFGSIPGEGQIMEEILEFDRRGHTPLFIAQTLNAGNVPTRYGKRWHSGTISKILSRHTNCAPVSPSQ
jgi:DNA invertase Pin-like site-specific DNA recombinase